MTTIQDPVVRALDKLVRTDSAAAAIGAALASVVQQLEASTRLMAWKVIPLEVFSGGLPQGIRSCWIFVIRAGAITGAERHPNSHQRSFSLIGSGTFELHDGAVWLAHPLVSTDVAGNGGRWVSIPRSTWHRLFVGPGTWGMVSFHTVASGELVEERPLRPDHLDGETHQERYIGRT